MKENPGIVRNEEKAPSGKVPPLPPKAIQLSPADVEAFNSGGDGEPVREVVPREIISNERDVLSRIESSNPVERTLAFAELLQNGDAESIQAAVDAATDVDVIVYVGGLDAVGAAAPVGAVEVDREDLVLAVLKRQTNSKYK